MSETTQQAIRAKAWATRRERYGPRGHGGTYERPAVRVTPSLAVQALRLICRLHREGVLSEGQCVRALGLSRVEWRTMIDRFAKEEKHG